MYYVNRDQIEQRLEFISVIVKALEELQLNWEEGNLLISLAQERTLQLAIESVTDIGSFMIDGFLMRDASSYEDIIEILHTEDVFPANIADALIELVRLRKPMVQNYFAFERNHLHPFIPILPEILIEFTERVRIYLDKELGE